MTPPPDYAETVARAEYLLRLPICRPTHSTQQDCICDLLAIVRQQRDYRDDQIVWFLDDIMSTQKGQVYAWNETYCIIDTPEDRYTVGHEHVFTAPPTADQAQAAAEAALAGQKEKEDGE